MSDPITEARFWAQVAEDARCTVVCCPQIEARCREYVAARGLSDVITVMSSPACPPDRLYVIDEQAIRGSLGRPVQWRHEEPT